MRRRQAVLLAVTALTLTYSGMWHWVLFASLQRPHAPSMWALDTVLHGLWYAGGLGLILFAHELGHILACKKYRIPFTGPYVLPSPFVMIGTFGAFIRTHAPYPHREALMMVGFCGPFMGMLATLPVLMLGLFWSFAGELPKWTPVIRFGKPWLLDVLGTWICGPGHLYLHPLAIAGWVGLLFTMLNLIPFRQFDGGHIVRAAFGSEIARGISALCFVGVILLATKSVTWAAIAVVMALDWHWIEAPEDRTTVPPSRWGYVTVAALIFLMCWNQIDVR